MKANEIFARISTRQVEGMMLHDQMADAYDFLTLPGYQSLHEYHFADESKGMREIHRYFIEHHNMLLNDGHPEDPRALPHSWMNYTRQQVTQDTKRKAVRELMEKWVDWERDTKRIYEQAYRDLVECGDIAGSMEVKRLILDVTEELAFAEQMYIRLEGVMYDMPTIEDMQERLCKKYRKTS